MDYHIPIRIDLARCEEVIHIAGLTGYDRHRVAGVMVEFWGWASRACLQNGLLPCLQMSTLVSIVANTHDDFWRAVEAVGWLQQTDEGIVVPQFGKWFSKIAKIRHDRNLRQQRWRGGRNVDGEVSTEASTEASTDLSTGALPTRTRIDIDNTNVLSLTPCADIHKPKRKRRLVFEDCDMTLAERFWDLVQVVNPTQKPPSMQQWANDIRLMREQDKRSIEEIQSLLSWSNTDPFWQNVILSPANLRKHWDQLQTRRKSCVEKAGCRQPLSAGGTSNGKNAKPPVIFHTDGTYSQ